MFDVFEAEQGSQEPAGRNRGTRWLAVGLIAALVALAGGAMTLSHLGHRGAAACDAQAQSSQQSLVDWMQAAVDQAISEPRDVVAAGCSQAQASVVDSGELEALEAALTDAGCDIPVTDNVPVTCRTSVDGVDLEVRLRAAADGDPFGDFLAVGTVLGLSA